MALKTHTLGLDASLYKEELKQVGEGVKLTSDKVRTSSDIIRKQASEVQKAAAGSTNYRKQLAQLQRKIVDMTINYRNLSEAEKNTARGKEMYAHIQELTKKAGEWKDAMMDTMQAVKAQASDTHLWDAAAQGLDIAKSGMESFISLTMSGKKGSEEFKSAMANLVKIETTFNTVIKLTNALQKQSALILGIVSIKAKALAAATALQTKNTIAAKVAQAALNKVAMANPYVLLAAAIAGVAAALAGMSAASEEGRQYLQKLDELMAELSATHDIILKSSSGVVSQFKEELLKVNALYRTVKNSNASYKDRQTALENLKKIVPEYHGGLTKEGKLINDNSIAIQNYIKNLKKMAENQIAFNRVVNIGLELGNLDSDINFMEQQYKALEKQLDLWEEKYGSFSLDDLPLIGKQTRNKIIEQEEQLNLKLKEAYARRNQLKSDQKKADADLAKIDYTGDFKTGGTTKTSTPKADKPSKATEKIDLKGAQQGIYSGMQMLQQRVSIPIEWDIKPPKPVQIQDAWKTMAETAETQIRDIMYAVEWGAISEDLGKELIDGINKTLEDANLKPIDNPLSSTFEKNFNAAADAVSTLSGAMQQLDSVEFQVAGIIGQAIATIALSFAQALKTCHTWIEWVAFGAVGLALMISMISSVKSATSGYEEGGIVNSGSLHGDKNLIRVNGGEMIMNTHQQDNLFRLLNGQLAFGPNKEETSQIIGVVKGADLQLVRKNLISKKAKIGKNII